MTSSSGPMTGRNSGIRSIGDSTHSIATTTATLARRGTRGSLRSTRMAVTQSGRNPARSLATPGGGRRASTIISSQVTTTSALAIRTAWSHPGISPPVDVEASHAGPDKRDHAIRSGSAALVRERGGGEFDIPELQARPTLVRVGGIVLGDVGVEAALQVVAGLVRGRHDQAEVPASIPRVRV